MVNTGYYEQSRYQIKEDDLAEISVYFVLYLYVYCRDKLVYIVVMY